MATSSLVVHCGARQVSRNELEAVESPPATDTWFPVKHGTVMEAVESTLKAAGFTIRDSRFALSRGDARMFSTLDLATPLGEGIALSVGVRNSNDKSFPLGFVAGSRVFVCDNLAFKAELLVRRKHTRFGQERFGEAIAQAVSRIDTFRETETQRIAALQQATITDETAEALMLRSFEKGIVSHRLLPRVIKEWRQPSFEAFQPRTSWSLLNAFTTILGDVQKSNPQRFVTLTMRLSALLTRDAEPEVTNAA